MKKFPKTISNKNDVELLLTEYPVETKVYLQNLLDNKNQWINTGKIEGNGITDDTHKVEILKDENDIVTEKYQYEYKVDMSGKIFQLGYNTIEEVEALTV